MRESISFYLNGQKKIVSGEHLLLPLSSYLRYEQQLTGTKVVCAEGDCGACTVMVAKYNPTETARYVSVNSCIALMFSLDACHIVTVEGLNQEVDSTESLSEIQNSMIRNFAAQCGFCTPGFVMSITNMYEQKTNPSLQNAKNYLTGNLCRCTGYSSILAAALDVDVNKHICINKKYPPLNNNQSVQEGIFVKTDKFEFFAPTTLQEACAYKFQHNDVIIFSGSTDLGVQFNKGHLRPKRILSLHLITELYKKSISDTHVQVGARVTLFELENLIKNKIPALNEFLNIFASPQIKNSATLVGNLANASPIGDTPPVMLTLDAELQIVGLNGSRQLALIDFYLGYKKINLAADEIITAVKFKVPELSSKFANYKISQRRDLDISTVNASFKFELENNKVKSARIAVGGVAATSLRLKNIETQVLNRNIDVSFIEETKKNMMNEVKPLTDVRGSSDYRRVLVGKLFEKFAQEHLIL